MVLVSTKVTQGSPVEDAIIDGPQFDINRFVLHISVLSIGDDDFVVAEGGRSEPPGGFRVWHPFRFDRLGED